MDADDFDVLTVHLSRSGSRRRLLGAAILLPALGDLLLSSGGEDALAKDRRRRRKQRHKQRKNPGARKHGCRARSRAQVCAGQCGKVKNRATCGKAVDCGPCDCGAPCNDERAPDCVQNSCVCAAAQDTACAVGSSCCASGCADLQRDNANCSACGHACPEGQTCLGGACRVPCGSTDCDPASEVCANDTCVACTVTCAANQTAAQCGTVLQSAFAGSDATVYVCPGTYAGGFLITRSVAVYGAGQGEDPAAATILDGGGVQGVLHVSESSATVHLERIRITGGSAEAGAGILAYQYRLELVDCTVSNNTARLGGGITQSLGTLDMTRCTVRDNKALPLPTPAALGGGLYLGANATLTDCLILDNAAGDGGGGMYIIHANVTLAGSTEVRGNESARGGGVLAVNTLLTIGPDCRITGNTADAGEGGGIFTNADTVDLQGPHPSPIVTDNCHENCVGSVTGCVAGGSCPV
ncbi:MAG: hypothetical protein QM692_10235 [Thermomicrobiales bacterium]